MLAYCYERIFCQFLGVVRQHFECHAQPQRIASASQASWISFKLRSKALLRRALPPLPNHAERLFAGRLRATTASAR
jgi:hypothetical protein